MQLRDAGKLSLEDEVSKHLSWFTIKQKYEDSGPITIRSLLTHSAGLPRQSNFPYWREPFDFPTIEQIKAQIDGMETLYPASTYFQYSNFGMSILGAVIEEVSGESFNEYVEKNILEVLDLKDTRPYMPKELLKGQLATGYSALDRSGDRREVDLFFTDGVTAAAGFTSTVEDLAKLLPGSLDYWKMGERRSSAPVRSKKCSGCTGWTLIGNWPGGWALLFGNMMGKLWSVMAVPARVIGPSCP
jgi:CubicO group peptidase (beta-lactamase class C family)